MTMAVLSPTMVAHSLALAELYLRDTRPVTTTACGTGVVGPCAWFVLQTKMNGEKKVCDALAGFGLESYVPTLRKEVYRRRKLVEREFRLFNRYVFARLPADPSQWGMVEDIEELDYVLGDHDGPCPVAEADIERFRAAETARAFDVTKAQRFPIGSRLRVLAAPFGGFSGQVVSLPGRGLVKAMIEIFGRLTPVEFKYDMVEPE